MPNRPPPPPGSDEQTLRAEIARLHKIIQAMMTRAEQGAKAPGSDFGLFHSAILLEEQVRRRTEELEAALREVQVLQARLREQAVRDPLTGLYNRHYLAEAFESELIRAERHGYSVSIVLADLDHFKRINDGYGHLAGDEVLRVFGEMLKKSSRGSDIYCRYGGEEFLLVLPGMEDIEAYERAELLRKEARAAAVCFHGAAIRVTASFGVATYPQHGAGSQQLIAAADQALYAAKDAGRDCVKCAEQRRLEDGSWIAGAAFLAAMKGNGRI